MVKYTRLLAVYGLLGSKIAERALCFIARYLGVNAVVLLGNTVSPQAIYRLSNECSVRVLGVLGELDNPVVAQALKAVQGLLECRLIEVNGVKLFGLGLSSCHVPKSSIDVLIASRPGVRVTCCGPGSDIVDRIYSACKSRVVLVGGCKHPCTREGVVSPGTLGLGYFGLLDVGEHGYTFIPYQLDGFVTRLLCGKNTTI